MNWGSFSEIIVVILLKRAQEENLISTIACLSSRCPDSLSEEGNNTLFEYQYNLDKLYKFKAEGAFVISRRHCLEEGEQNSAYLFRLEKSLTKNNIHPLKIGHSLKTQKKWPNIVQNSIRAFIAAYSCHGSWIH